MAMLFGRSGLDLQVVSLLRGGPGVFIDGGDPSVMYQDAGNTPVTTIGQTVARINDKSGNGHHATVTGGTLAQDSSGRYNVAGTALEMSLGVLPFMSAPAHVVAAWRSDSKAGSRCIFGSPKYSYGHYATSGAARFTTLGTKDYQLVPLFGIGAPAISSYIVDPTSYDATGYHNGTVEPTGPVAGGGIDSTGTNNAATKIGREYSGGTALDGGFYGLIAKPSMTSGQRILCETFFKTRATIREFAVIGDSTIGFYSTFRSVPDMANNFPTRLIALSGDNIAGQKTKWEALTDYSLFPAVFIQIGLNDLDPAEAASVMIARLQSLVVSVNAKKPGGCKTYVSQIIPNRARLITLYGGVNGPIAYQKWLDFNAAIAGTGPTPITGVEARINGHMATLNDGAGNLAAAFNSGDDLHENDLGRQVIADGWRAQLVTDGLL